MLEFQERVKRILPVDNRELAYLLPKNRCLAEPLRDSFIEGLPWRSTDSFNSQTDKLVTFFLSEMGNQTRDLMLEELVGLGTRPNHPYSANRLWRYLGRMTMPNRDIFWSEYLRSCNDTSVVFKIIEWVERTTGGQAFRDSASCSMMLLALFCTTTRRPLRDRATRAMVRLGENHPDVLVEATLNSLSFNDPYVSERLLAACYGVAMRNWARPDRANIHESLVVISKELINLMFLPGAPYATKHVLRRDYALGIINLANRLVPSLITTGLRRYLTPPFRHFESVFPPPSKILSKHVDPAKSAIRMDFDNYTIGALVLGRKNYDGNNPEYLAIRKQILWRIHDLGYRRDLFHDIDDRIESGSFNDHDDSSNRTIRYGKKYAWIAYFEMYGVRHDQKKIEAWMASARVPDIDIDPSFPVQPRQWSPRLCDDFSSAPTDPRQWIQAGPSPNYRDIFRLDIIDNVPGPWTVLEGYIDRGAQDGRHFFTFLRGVFMRHRHIQQFARELHALPHLSNYAISEVVDDNYTFAGEIPWSPRFATSLRFANGKPRRDLRRLNSDRGNSSARGSIEVPVYRFSWESYHCSLNEISGVYCLAPALADSLHLVNRGEDWDLFDASGKRATMFVRFKGLHDTFHSYLLYIRHDLLCQYLHRTNQALVVVPWGERLFKHDRFERSREAVSDLLRDYKHTYHSVFADLGR